MSTNASLSLPHWVLRHATSLFIEWPVGLMDKASASGAGDSRFESWAGHISHSYEIPHAAV